MKIKEGDIYVSSVTGELVLVTKVGKEIYFVAPSTVDSSLTREWIAGHKFFNNYINKGHLIYVGALEDAK